MSLVLVSYDEVLIFMTVSPTVQCAGPQKLSRLRFSKNLDQEFKFDGKN
jgi:hypothetical protein